MGPSAKPILLVLGGIGAQNSVIIKGYAATDKYTIRVLTRSSASSSALEVASLPGIQLLEGSLYDEDDLATAFEGVDYVYVNTNGFATGESKEIYWGIRIYEHAIWAGVRHFVYSGLPYVTKNGGFDPKRRVPFVDGKGKVVQYLKAQPQEPMKWTVLSSGPYADRLWDNAAPEIEADGTYVFPLPLGAMGAMPLVSLPDMAKYAVWILNHPSLSAGLELGIAIAHVTGAEIAEAFTKVTGKKARWHDVPLEVMLQAFPPGRIGASFTPGFDDRTNLSAAEHFGPWYNIFRDSGSNTGAWKRNYDLLDEILPERERTIEEWMRREKYDGTHKPVLRTGLSLSA